MDYTNWTFKNFHNNIYYNILNSILFISAYFSCEGLHVLKKLRVELCTAYDASQPKL